MVGVSAMLVEAEEWSDFLEWYSSFEAQEKDVAEVMDPAMIGNVYHNTMWALFTSEDEMVSDKVYDKRDVKPEPMRRVTLEYLVSWQGREKDVRRDRPCAHFRPRSLCRPT